MDVYNLSYNELQKSIVQVQREHFTDGHASPAFIRERVIVADTSRNPKAIAKDNLAFAGATRSNTQYFTTESKQLI